MSGRAQAPGGKTWATIPILGGRWEADAACRLEDAHRFTRDTRPGTDELRALSDICHSCPVTAQCARFALQNHLHGFYAGVWIGEDGRARTALRRQSRDAS